MRRAALLGAAALSLAGCGGQNTAVTVTVTRTVAARVESARADSLVVTFLAEWPTTRTTRTYRFVLPRPYAYGDPPAVRIDTFDLVPNEWIPLSAHSCRLGGFAPLEARALVRQRGGEVGLDLELRGSDEPFDQFSTTETACYSLLSAGALYPVRIAWP